MSLKKNSLKTTAKKIRLKIFETIIQAGKGHIGGAFSCVDILVALYFLRVFKVFVIFFFDLEKKDISNLFFASIFAISNPIPCVPPDIKTFLFFIFVIS